MKKKPVVICCSVLLALILVLAIVLVVLYFTVFRPRSPHVVATVVSSRVSQFDVTGFPAVLPKVNMSLDVDVTVKNPNYAAFRYGDVVTELTYHGLPVGKSVVLAGEVGARTTQTVGATVVVQADKVVYTPDFLQDVFPKLFDLLNLTLPFQTRTTVAGKAVVLGTFKISASSVVTCKVITYPLKQESTSECTSTVNVG